MIILLFNLLWRVFFVLFKISQAKFNILSRNGETLSGTHTLYFLTVSNINHG